MNIETSEYSLVKLDYRMVKPFQGDLKEKMNPDDERKLLNSLKSKGKFVPEFVFRDSEDGEYYSLDGHRRLEIYKKHGVKFGGSYKIDFLLIDAKNKQDAKEKLLLLNSHYGKITESGLKNFMSDMEDVSFSLETVSFLEFDNLDFMKSAQGLSKEMENMNMSFKREPLSNSKPTPTNETENRDNETPKVEHKTVQYEESQDEDFDAEDEVQEAYETKAEGRKETQPVVEQTKLAKYDFVSYNEVMEYSQKKFLTEVIFAVKTKLGLRTNADALIHIVKEYEKLTAENG
jgi:hypothetical protein